MVTYYDIELLEGNKAFLDNLSNNLDIDWKEIEFECENNHIMLNIICEIEYWLIEKYIEDNISNTDLKDELIQNLSADPLDITIDVDFETLRKKYDNISPTEKNILKTLENINKNSYKFEVVK